MLKILAKPPLLAGEKENAGFFRGTQISITSAGSDESCRINRRQYLDYGHTDRTADQSQV